MEAPRGRAVGNRLEVEEAWQVLSGDGDDDVREVTLTLAGALLSLSDLGVDEAQGRALAEQALADGRAAAHFERWCFVQGGRWTPGQFHRLATVEVRAVRGGYVAGIDALAVGRAAQLAGAGRQKVDEDVDPAAGVMLARKVGEPVAAGDVLCTVYARQSTRRASAAAALQGAFTVADEAPPAQPVVLGREPRKRPLD
jgi:thymidine phosphorylase